MNKISLLRRGLAQENHEIFFICSQTSKTTDKLENTMQTVMKMLANCLSSQRGIQYEFGPEYTEYLAQKATGTLKQSHLRPLSLRNSLTKFPLTTKSEKITLVSCQSSSDKKVDLLFALLEST